MYELESLGSEDGVRESRGCCDRERVAKGGGAARDLEVASEVFRIRDDEEVWGNGGSKEGIEPASTIQGDSSGEDGVGRGVQRVVQGVADEARITCAKVGQVIDPDAAGHIGGGEVEVRERGPDHIGATVGAGRLHDPVVDVGHIVGVVSSTALHRREDRGGGIDVREEISLVATGHRGSGGACNQDIRSRSTGQGIAHSVSSKRVPHEGRIGRAGVAEAGYASGEQGTVCRGQVVGEGGAALGDSDDGTPGSGIDDDIRLSGATAGHVIQVRSGSAVEGRKPVSDQGVVGAAGDKTGLGSTACCQDVRSIGGSHDRVVQGIADQGDRTGREGIVGKDELFDVLDAGPEVEGIREIETGQGSPQRRDAVTGRLDDPITLGVHHVDIVTVTPDQNGPAVSDQSISVNSTADGTAPDECLGRRARNQGISTGPSSDQGSLEAVAGQCGSAQSRVHGIAYGRDPRTKGEGVCEIDRIDRSRKRVIATGGSTNGVSGKRDLEKIIAPASGKRGGTIANQGRGGSRKGSRDQSSGSCARFQDVAFSSGDQGASRRTKKGAEIPGQGSGITDRNRVEREIFWIECHGGIGVWTQGTKRDPAVK